MRLEAKVSQETGFIGLGAMGKPMALNMLKADIPLIVHDLDPTKTKSLASAGATVGLSPKDIAAATNRIICLVETTDQANDVICGPDGIINGAIAGNIVICMSTIDPLVAKKMGKKLSKKGIMLLDAPVSGGTERASKATLSVIVGGEEEAFNKCQDIFKAVGNNVFHIGEQGKGLIMKLINNMLGITNTITLVEGLTIGVKSGIGLETMLSVLKTSSGASAAVDLRVPRIIDNNFEPGGTMDIVYKDQELITAYAKQIGVPTLMANVSQQVYQMARTAGLNKKDSSAVVKVYENLANVEIVGRK